jgi:hypothetical protein
MLYFENRFVTNSFTSFICMNKKSLCVLYIVSVRLIWLFRHNITANGQAFCWGSS